MCDAFSEECEPLSKGMCYAFQGDGGHLFRGMGSPFPGVCVTPFRGMCRNISLKNKPLWKGDPVVYIWPHFGARPNFRIFQDLIFETFGNSGVPQNEGKRTRQDRLSGAAVF